MEQIIYAGQLTRFPERSANPAATGDTVASEAGREKARRFDQALAELGDMDVLYSSYRSRIYRYALLSLRDPELAESLTHDCLLKAHNARAQFRGDCSVATWLTRIATNLIRDHIRSRKMQFWKAASNTAVDIGEIADRMRAPGLTPEASLLVRERVKHLWEHVENLSGNQRSVFLLRFVEEQELADIAAAMNMNIGTVKSHLHRALSAIRVAMEKSK